MINYSFTVYKIITLRKFTGKMVRCKQKVELSQALRRTYKTVTETSTKKYLNDLYLDND